MMRWNSTHTHTHTHGDATTFFFHPRKIIKWWFAAASCTQQAAMSRVWKIWTDVGAFNLPICSNVACVRQKKVVDSFQIVRGLRSYECAAPPRSFPRFWSALLDWGHQKEVREEVLYARRLELRTPVISVSIFPLFLFFKSLFLPLLSKYLDVLLPFKWSRRSYERQCFERLFGTNISCLRNSPLLSLKEWDSFTKPLNAYHLLVHA